MLRFILVGGMGFAADALAFYCCLHLLLLDISLSRILAFLLAASVTWLGNRFFTFAHRQQHKASSQWCWHICVASFGFGLNFVAFQLLLNQGVVISAAFVMATLLAMLSNYVFSHFIVFRARSDIRGSG